MRAQLRLLVVGGRRPELREAAEQARGLGASVLVAASIAEALTMLRCHGAELVMAEVDLDVPRLIAAMRNERMVVPVIACGVDAPAPLAVAAVQAGAADYVSLPPSRELIAQVLLSVGERRGALLGQHPALLAAIAHAERFAASRAPILIRGEHGTGKEVLARQIHERSGRTGPFVMVEAAGVADDVLASELFGHAEGDFPGAVAPRAGKIAEASAGTLLIRNVDALGQSLQASLVAHADQGSTRLIATASADLQAIRAAGLFRADLLDRFSLVTVDMPPLRERADDLPVLAKAFADQFVDRQHFARKSFSGAALCLLATHDWPGNVRELEQLVHRAMLLARGPAVEPVDLVLDNGDPLQPASPGECDPARVDDLVGRRVDDVERELILRTLRHCNGNRTSASGILGISVRTMRNKLKSFQQAGYPVARAL